MKHKIHMIWTSDQMRRIQAKNIRTVHNDKERHINFDKRVSWRSFFMICSDWMNKRRELMIVSQYMIHKTNHKHMIYKDRKSMKHCCSWTTYEHEHELNFNHDQKSHHKTWHKYEDFEIFSVVRRYCNRTMLVSSLKILMKLLICTWSQSRMNMWISEELSETAQSYTEAMSMISMRLIRMIRSACCSETTSYLWMSLFSLFVRLACLL